MIAFAVSQAEQPLLEDRVLAVPQCEGKTQPLVVVAQPGETVFAPVLGPRAGLVVGEIVPRIAVAAVILAHRAPLAFAEVRSPLLPRHAVLARLVQTLLFGGIGNLHSNLVRQCSPPVLNRGSSVLPDPAAPGGE